MHNDKVHQDDHKQQSSSSPFNNLPDVVIAHISTYLSTPELVCNASIINHQWHNVIFNSTIGLYLWSSRHIKLKSADAWHLWTKAAQTEANCLLKEKHERNQEEEEEKKRLQAAEDAMQLEEIDENPIRHDDDDTKISSIKQTTHANAPKTESALNDNTIQTTDESSICNTSSSSSAIALKRLSLCPYLTLYSQVHPTTDKTEDEKTKWSHIFQSKLYWCHFTSLRALSIELIHEHQQTDETIQSFFIHLSALGNTGRLEALSIGDLWISSASTWLLLAPLNKTLQSLDIYELCRDGVVTLQKTLPQLKVLHIWSNDPLPDDEYPNSQDFRALRNWTTLQQFKCGLDIWEETNINHVLIASEALHQRSKQDCNCLLCDRKCGNYY
jgi:hypothetical protein